MGEVYLASDPKLGRSVVDYGRLDDYRRALYRFHFGAHGRASWLENGH